MSLAVDRKNNLLWVSCRCGGPGGRPGHDNIDVLDLAGEHSVRTVGGPPIVGGHIAISPNGALVAVDGSDACTSPHYDKVGCPPDALGVVQVFRAADGKHLATLQTSASGFLHFAPDSSRLLHANGKHLAVFETSAFRQVESVEQQVMYVAVTRERQEILTVLREPDEWVAALLPDVGCDYRPDGLSFMHWPADGIFTDLGGAGHGSPRDVQFRPGMLGQAFHLNGSSSFIETPPGDFGFFLNPNTTYMFWLKPARSGFEETLVERIIANQPQGWRIFRRADDRIEFEFPTVNEDHVRLTSGVAVAKEKWSHIAFVTQKQSLELYIDGKLQGSLAGWIRDRKGGRFRFGAGLNKKHFAGLMDEITAHDRILTAQEIMDIGAKLRRCHVPSAR